MAGCTEFRDVFSFRFSSEGPVLGQFYILFLGVPSMTALTAQPGLVMDIQGESLHRSKKLFLHLLMAGDTTAGLSRKGGQEKEEDRKRGKEEDSLFDNFCYHLLSLYNFGCK